MLKQVFSFSKIIFCFFFFASSLYANPWLGVSFNKQAYPDKLELLVRGVHPTSDAIRVGLEAGDIIEKINGKILKDNEDYNNMKDMLTGKILFESEEYLMLGDNL